MNKKNFDSIINALRSDEVQSFKYFSELIDVIETNITKEINIKIEPINLEFKKIEDQLPKIEDDPKLIQEIIKYIIEEEKDSYILWENVIWSSLFLSIYGNFESKINQICLIIKRKDNIALSPNDLKGTGLARSRMYLKKVASYSFSIKNEAWVLTEKHNNIRNIIIHNEGVLEKSNHNYTKIYNFIKDNDHLTIDKKNRIILNKNFVKEAKLLFYNTYLTICDELVGL